MIIKVKNETPFQVLTGAFSIGPSQTGYELQVGATPDDFSTLFSVGANTTRMVTNVANGSYYRLKNNVGEVTVNWSRTCVTEGGGGDMSNYYTKDETDALIESALTSGVSLDGYWTSAETKAYVDSADTAILAEVGSLSAVVQEQQIVFSSGYNELHTQVMELSGRTVDLSGYYTSAQTEQAITSKNYVTSAQVETQITGKNYITSAALAGYATTGDVLNISGAVVEAQSAITGVENEIAEISGMMQTKELVISTALNQLNNTKVGSASISTIWSGTQGAYDALTNSGATADPSTFYIILPSA